MKTINNILRFLAPVLALLSCGLFFVDFATVNTATANAYSAAQFAWGMAGDITAKSAKLAFCMILAIITLVCTLLAAFKKKGWRYAAPGFGIVVGIFMLVVALSHPAKFIDLRPVIATGISSVEYTVFALLIAIGLLLATIVSVGYLFTSDYLEVMESNGSKMLLGQRIVKFFRDYRGEVKKIYWPGPKMVVKNTIIVLIMCALVGAFIWLLDFGLGELINLILGV